MRGSSRYKYIGEFVIKRVKRGYGKQYFIAQVKNLKIES